MIAWAGNERDGKFMHARAKAEAKLNEGGNNA